MLNSEIAMFSSVRYHVCRLRTSRFFKGHSSVNFPELIKACKEVEVVLGCCGEGGGARPGLCVAEDYEE